MLLKKLKRIFKEDQRKPTSGKKYKKRKFLGSVSLGLILVFGRPKLASAESSNQDHNNYLAHERVILNKLGGVFITPNPSMEKMCRTLSKEYRDYQRDFN